MKVGTVALIGRPNTGKSTLVNNLVGHKVSITSPKPQTTRFSIYAVYEDEREQIIFIDTPGIFAKTQDKKNKQINLEAQRILKEEINVIIYLIDPTRERGPEENRVLGIMRKIDIPKILVINKSDILGEKSYIEQYKFLEDEFGKAIEISALKSKNLGALLDAIFSHLKEGKRLVVKEDLPVPVLNLNSKTYIEENIREKAFLVLRDEVPYQVKVMVDQISERKNGFIYIKARMIAKDAHYKKMIIGHSAHRIKQINMMARKELELSTGKKIYLALTVEAE
ncbi:MAG: GTPase Era [Candidatus Levybacteria bacterium RIFCSPHIGHO2_01_FULL_36_15]|nr:MAG: GTPase Era [Candidatus Levybacteria bacterium RIFCSPHIGHO2_01_FULL_36_15]OGH38021.1 MAG: GTPase Era [Candidatus Levybacteria bacterium RIFCSPLOWO2_01_FULL_36_10]